MNKIVLPHAHYHAGKRMEAGEVIELDDAQYEWFMAATLEARMAQIAAAEQRVGSPEWAERSRAASRGAVEPGPDDGEAE